MKASEVRIGNLFQDQNGNLLEVDSINKSGYVFHVADRSKYPLEAGWKAEPIPLTEEWLKRFGFEKFENSSICCTFHKGFNEVTHDYLFQVTWMKKRDGTLDDVFYRNARHKIEYVHQLQNLYHALTGEELETKEA